MPIYGLNFNSTQIPPDLAKRFSKRRSMGQRIMAHLDGVATSEKERDAMLIQADNGRRRLHVEVRKTAAGTIYGIYTYSAPCLARRPAPGADRS